jgi:translation initiation factor 1A
MAKKFKDKSRANSKVHTETENGFVRVRLPRGRQIIGIIAQRLGNSRMFVSCMDGKTRNCRVPGSKKRGLWLRENDVVMIEPWEFDDEKGDVEYKYTPNEARKLKELGYLQTNSEEF